MSTAPARSSRINLWLILVICVAPVLASYFAYYFLAPGGRTNHGDLLETRLLPDTRLQLNGGAPFQLSQLRGKWVLLMADGAACDSNCERKLFMLRQLRLTQGKDMERIERAWLLTDAGVPSDRLLRGYEGTWIVRAAGSDMLAALPASRSPLDHIYIVDPLGNLVLRYASDADPSGIIKDLARLLKSSRIG